MKKCKENKKTVPSKIKPKQLDICNNCTNKYCSSTTHSGAISVSPKASKTSIGKKVSRMSNNAKCNCSKYLDHAAMLDTITDNNICSCGILAKALRSDVHMNIGTLVHQGCNSATEDNVIENN